ncbi:hypothetical protein [Oceanispirochaeta sp.]|jgi:hypothetical protein|uniref:hypothetical protein n=1 Tax=Oceanispirochaeta sp. TaxID=2035350 RepID=UPI00260BB6C2|nr:hypothetical protein [Oceanispirochaeta sp.]MDA3956507.1 hypothetical protein [Oceanispirochaeta sp.]
MSRRLIPLVLLLFLKIALYSQENTIKDSPAVFRESLDFISGMESRQEGSKDEKAVFSYIEDFLISRNFSYEFQGLTDIEDYHSFSSNLVVTIPGKNQEQLILAVPVDTPVNADEAGNDLALNAALALAFMNEWTALTPPITLIFLFSSADNFQRGYVGSPAFLKNYSYQADSCLVYLLLKEKHEIPEIFGSTPGLNAPAWLMEGLRISLTAAGLESRIDSTALLINRAGLSTRYLPIIKYLDEDIPAAALISSGSRGAPIENQAVLYLDFLHKFTKLYEHDFPENWETNYFYLGRDGSIVSFLSERNLLILYVFMISLVLILPLFQQRSIYLNYRKFRHQLWLIPVMVYLSFLFFMISTLMLEELRALHRYSDLWKQYPLYFFILKSITVLFLSSFFLNMLRGLPFPRNPHFYSYFAFIISFINLIIVSLFNISFSPIMLISLIFVFLFVTSRQKVSKRVFMILSILPQLLVLLFLFSRDYITVYDFSIFSRIKGNWVLTFITLPLICMISSLSFYHHHYDKSRQEVKTALMTLVLALTTVFMVYFSFQLEPFSPGFRQNLILTDKFNLDSQHREVLLSSPGNIGSGRLILGSTVVPFTDIGNEMRIQGEIEGNPLEVQWETDLFLDRRIIDLTIYSELEPEEIQLNINSDATILLYDCPYPYEIQPDLKSVKISIGLNPPMPLKIPLIFSRDSSPNIEFHVTKNKSTYMVELDKKQIDLERHTIVSKTISFSEIQSPSVQN